MSLFQFSSTRSANLAIAAGVFAAGLALAETASASVLVEPRILDQDAENTDATSSGSASANIVEVAGDASEFSTLAAAVQAANLGDILSADGPYTMFAPTDEAFAALPEGALDALLLPENNDLLVRVLYNHVGYGNITSAQLASGPIDTFDGIVDVDVMPEGVTVDGANVVQADIGASNGVIHAVDRVLLPEGFTSQLQARIDSSAAASASSSSSSSSSTTSTITRTTTLQQGAIDRSTAPVAPAATPAPEPEPQPEPAAQEPVRGLW